MCESPSLEKAEINRFRIQISDEEDIDDDDDNILELIDSVQRIADRRPLQLQTLFTVSYAKRERI